MEHGPIYQIPDREAALEAVKQDGDALENASEDLQADRGVVLEAVKQNGRARARLGGRLCSAIRASSRLI